MASARRSMTCTIGSLRREISLIKPARTDAARAGALGIGSGAAGSALPGVPARLYDAPLPTSACADDVEGAGAASDSAAFRSAEDSARTCRGRDRRRSHVPKSPDTTCRPRPWIKVRVSGDNGGTASITRSSGFGESTSGS